MFFLLPLIITLTTFCNLASASSNFQAVELHGHGNLKYRMSTTSHAIRIWDPSTNMATITMITEDNQLVSAGSKNTLVACYIKLDDKMGWGLEILTPNDPIKATKCLVLISLIPKQYDNGLIHPETWLKSFLVNTDGNLQKFFEGLCDHDPYSVVTMNMEIKEPSAEKRLFQMNRLLKNYHRGQPIPKSHLDSMIPPKNSKL